MLWRIPIFFLAYWVLAAHFLRYGDLAVAGVIALAPVAICFRHKLVIRALQAGLVLGSLGIWLPTIYEIASMRIAMGDPWLRMAMILFAVILFSLLSAWAINPIYKQQLSRHI